MAAAGEPTSKFNVSGWRLLPLQGIRLLDELDSYLIPTSLSIFPGDETAGLHPRDNLSMTGGLISEALDNRPIGTISTEDSFGDDPKTIFPTLGKCL